MSLLYTGRWAHQQDGGKSRGHRVSAGNALTSFEGISQENELDSRHLS